MKCHFIEQFTSPMKKFRYTETGKFVEFCPPAHSFHGKIKAFKLSNIAGAYWLGKEAIPSSSASRTSFYSKKRWTSTCPA